MANDPKSHDDGAREIGQPAGQPTPAGQDQDQIASLAAFPAENPLPVLRVGSDGVLLYANRASQDLLEGWDCRPGQRVPGRIYDLIAECLASGRLRETDVACRNLVFSIMFAPLVDKAYVNLYARDVTERRQAEAALAISEQRLRLALESAKLGTWQVDLRTGKGLQDARSGEIFGYPPDQTEAHLSEWEARIHPEDRERVMGEFYRMVRGDGPYDTQFRVLRPDGSLRWVAATAQLQYDPAGRPIRTYGVAADITERKQAEQALRQSEEKYRSIFRTAGNLIISVDRQGTVVDCNPRVEDVLGYAREEVIGLHMSQIVHPDDFPVACAALQDILADGKVHRGEYRMVCKDGRIIDVSISSSSLRNETDSGIRTVCIIQDITEHRQAMEALRRRDEQLRIAQRAAGAGMWDWYPQTNEVTWSEEYYDVYGLDRSVAPSYDNWIASIVEQDRQSTDRAMRDALAACTDTHIEFRIHHPRRGLRWLASIGRTICDPHGRAVRMTGLTLDITDRRQFLEQLQALNATLEQRVAERTAVAEERAAQLRMLAAQLTRAEERERRRVAHILHEHFQQLLAAVKFHIGVIRKHVHEENALRSVQQVNDALDEAIGTSRSLTVELSPPILYDAGLAEALAWLGRWMEERHGLKVNVQADPAAEPESEDIRIALFLATRELLYNVVKHANVDRAAISMSFGDDRRTRVAVSDAGIGFDAATTGDTSGGFGLFGIRERIGMLGGRMEVYSTPGRGTRVVVEGPPPSVSPTLPPQAALDGRTAEPIPPAGSPAGRAAVRVLIADDHAIVRDGLVRLLGDYADIEVVGQAVDGAVAVETARQLEPDVVVMDVSMPRLDGVEATRRIVTQLPQIRVIGLSMHAEADMAARMREAGAIAYLPKSGPPEDLVSAIRLCASRSHVDSGCQ